MDCELCDSKKGHLVKYKGHRYLCRKCLIGEEEEINLETHIYGHNSVYPESMSVSFSTKERKNISNKMNEMGIAMKKPLLFYRFK